MNLGEKQTGAGNGCLITLLLLTLPLAYGNWSVYKQWSNARVLNQRGKVVDAEVVSYGISPNRAGATYGVTYRLPADLNPQQQTTHATVSEEVYRRAERSKKIEVQVLPERPAVQRAVGSSGLGWVVILLAVLDVALLAALAIFILGA